MSHLCSATLLPHFTLSRMKAGGFTPHPFECSAVSTPADKFYQKQQTSLASVVNSNINAIASNYFLPFSTLYMAPGYKG
jgi:hypothetical protein